jgi:hypothetical protein
MTIATASNAADVPTPAQVLPWQHKLAVAVAATKPPVEVIALNRMAFGPAPSDLARVRTMGVSAYIEEQLHPSTIDDSACDARLAAANLQYLNANVPTLWALSYSEAN